jgi:DNA-binding IclR family transcriptional regulator
MRILRRFTIPDLVATAEIQRANVQAYLIGLERAGYVRREAERQSGHRLKCVVFRLIHDTGPQAPTLHKGQVRDLNTLPEITHD